MTNTMYQALNWQRLAQEADWSVSTLAEVCHVSVRTLERHFRATIGKSPKFWLTDHRQRQALELLRNGHSVKETALELGYRHPNHFSRDFARNWGVCPTKYVSVKSKRVSLMPRPFTVVV